MTNCKKNPNECPCNHWCIAVGADPKDCPDFAPALEVDFDRYVPSLSMLEQLGEVMYLNDFFNYAKNDKL